MIMLSIWLFSWIMYTVWKDKFIPRVWNNKWKMKCCRMVRTYFKTEHHKCELTFIVLLAILNKWPLFQWKRGSNLAKKLAWVPTMLSRGGMFLSLKRSAPNLALQWIKCQNCSPYMIEIEKAQVQEIINDSVIECGWEKVNIFQCTRHGMSTLQRITWD